MVLAFETRVDMFKIPSVAVVAHYYYYYYYYLKQKALEELLG